MANDYSVYVPDKEADAEPFPIEVDDPSQIDLTEKTESEELRARLWYFEPGDKVSLHYHNDQEELYHVVKGTGQVVVGEDREEIEVSEGGFFHPKTETPRHLRNDSDEEAVWLIVGAPPVVEAQLWDSYDENGYPTEEGQFTDLDEWF